MIVCEVAGRWYQVYLSLKLKCVTYSTLDTRYLGANCKLHNIMAITVAVSSDLIWFEIPY